jgi:UDP-glucuronate 4-epimerase
VLNFAVVRSGDFDYDLAANAEGAARGWPWYHLMMMKASHPIPIHSDGPNLFNPIHEDDIIAMVPHLLEVADVPATVVNWGGSEAVSIEAWCAHLEALTGLESRLEVSPNALGALPVDLTRMHAWIGRTRVAWCEGMRRMVESRNPELLPGSG